MSEYRETLDFCSIYSRNRSALGRFGPSGPGLYTSLSPALALLFARVELRGLHRSYLQYSTVYLQYYDLQDDHHLRTYNQVLLYHQLNPTHLQNAHSRTNQTTRQPTGRKSTVSL